VLAGGVDQNGVALNDVWLLRVLGDSGNGVWNIQWTTLPDLPFSGRSEFTGASNDALDVVLLFGGRDARGVVGEYYALQVPVGGVAPSAIPAFAPFDSSQATGAFPFVDVTPTASGVLGFDGDRFLNLLGTRGDQPVCDDSGGVSDIGNGTDGG
jgi:hypothetical protein